MIKNGLVRLKLIGFNKYECDSLHAILTLAHRALTKKWQVVETAEADFFLLSVTATTANNDPVLTSQQAEHCLFCVTNSNATTTNGLLVDDKHVPSLKAMVSLFNQLSENLTDTDSPNKLNPPLSTQNPLFPEKAFHMEKGLLGHLLATQHKQLILSLNKEPDYPSVYIDIEKSIYHSRNNLAQLSPYLTDLPEALKISPCSKIEIENLITLENLKAYPLKDLIWYIVIQTSAGRLMKGHSATDIVTLKGWPDLRLYKCIEYAKVAAFMKNNATPLETIASETKTSLEKVYDFYNACYLAGLIEKRNQIEINKKNISAQRLELLNKIDARLK